MSKINLPNITLTESQIVKSNQQIIFNESLSFWLVKTGEIAIFALEIIEGELEGPRRYLFSVIENQILPGYAPIYEGKTLIGVAVGTSELIKLSLADLSELKRTAPENYQALIESYLYIIQSLFKNLELPQVVRRSKESLTTLTKDHTFAPEIDEVAWIVISEGKACWLGLEEFCFTDEDPTFPLTSKMWLTAQTDCQLHLKATIDLEVENFCESIKNVQQIILKYIENQEKQKLIANKLKLEQQKKQDLTLVENSLGELTSLLQKREENPFVYEEDTLLIAMGAIGKALGVKIQPISKSEDVKRLKNPLEGIVRASGLRMRSVLLGNDWWLSDSGPLLGYTEEEEAPVALIPLGGKRYRIFDPSKFTKTLVNEEIAQTLKLNAFMFYIPFKDKPLEGLEVFNFAFKGRAWDLVLIVTVAISTTLLNMLVPIFTGNMVNQAIPEADSAYLFQMGVMLIVAGVGVALFNLTQGFTLLRIATASDAVTQAAVWDRVLKLPVSFFRQYSSGDLRTRISAITEIRQQLSGSVLSTLLSGLFAVLNLGLMLYYSWPLAVLALVVALVYVLVTVIHGWLTVIQNRRLLEIQGVIFGLVVQLINGVSKLRVAGAEKRALAYWAKVYRKQVSFELSLQMIADSLNLSNEILTPLSTITLFWLAIFSLQWAEIFNLGVLSIGNFIAFNSAYGIFIGSTTQLSNTLITTLNVYNLWQRTLPIIKGQPEVKPDAVDPGRLSGGVSLDRVSFRYQEDGPLILKDVSIQAQPGEFIALVGASGSGKSTILRLLLGFEIPESGAIYYDSQDLSKLNLEAIRRQLGVVLQNGRLQSGSIFDNIAAGALINQDEAWEAVRMAGFASDIEAMPMKMFTVISEGGGNISGGQKQRLLIARALALKPKIILFDEATSALDNNTQAIVSESLDKMQVTRIVIAHRLSTIRNADRIYVLDKGQVVQSGSFEDLLKVDGLFAQLMARQMA